MKYRAVCPGCGAPISRQMVFRVPALPHRCERCGSWYRSHALWEWMADVIMAATLAGLVWLAWSHRLPRAIAVILALVVLAASYIFFPYITPFVFIAPQSQDKSNPEASA